MKKVTCLLAALLLACGLSWAQQITWTAADQGYDNGQVIESVDFNDYVAGEFFKGSNNNEPKYYTMGAAIRCYGGNYFTITSDYVLTEIVFGFGSGDGSNAITSDVGTYENGTWTGSANEVTFTIGGTSGHRRFATFTITYDEGGSPAPSITASNVEIAYDATSGAIAYTINNPVDGGELTAATEAEWLTIGTVGETVPFTCSVNEDGAAREAVVTLTYTYGEQAINKAVTVAQAGNPNALNSISDITAAGTYAVQGTIVAKSTRGFIVGDGTGYVYYYNTNYEQDAYAIGDMVKLAGNVVVYGGVFEFNNSTTVTPANSSNYVAEEPTVITGEEMDARVASTTPAQLSNYVQYEGTLSINNNHYNITNIAGATTAIGSISYPLDTEFADLDGHQVKVSGYYVGISSSTYYNTMIGTIEEVTTTDPIITITPATLNVDAEEHLVNYLDLAYENIDVENGSSFTVHYYNAEGEEIQVVPGEAWMIAGVVKPNDVYQVLCVIVANEGEARTSYFKVSAVDAENNTVYSNLVTVNQEAYVAPTYAELPFAFNSGRAAIEETDGLYQEGLGSDYGTDNTKLKFDNTGDWLLLQFDERPGTLTFDIKGNGFNGSTFTVQTSEDGTTYSDLATYTELTSTVLNEEFTNLGENVRYIKWIYTEKVQSGGNVGLGNIALAEYTEPQQYTLTVEPFENLDLITFVNDEMVLEGDGEIQVTNGDQIMLSVVAMEGYVMETLMVNGVNHVNDIADDFTYTFVMPAENVTISATAVEDVPPTPGEWVMVGLNDLTEDDVFVIVGVYDEDESSFALPNSYGTGNAPSAVDVTMVGNTLAGDIAENLKWNLSIGEDGYTFYPNGETESWLYCNNTNNGVRVGTNENNVFTMTPEGYLYNNATSRYIGIYNRQDWRCYTSINNNIKNQTFAFYKRVDEGSLVTYTLDIEGYGESDGGYYLIASPVSMIRPTFENGFITETYDLYYFDQAQNDFEWRNYKANHFNIAAGKGYLYASQENTTLTFTGIPYVGNGEFALDYVEGVNLTGWNLIGNPYDYDNYLFIRTGDEYAEANFFVMNENGDDFELAQRSVVHPMEGILVEADAANQIACFSTEIGVMDDPITKLNIRVSDENGKGDFARIRFGEGNNLEKFMLNPENTKIYFPVDGEEYAVVYADNMGEMPLNFSAAADGTYTLNINPEDMEMEYLHLIDNMTGMDVDLLANPSYSFEATTNDNAARFTLVFAGLTGIEENSDNFAFFSNGNVIVSNEGNAMLQVVDMNGRIVKSENINGTTSVSVEAAPGVYMLRLVNGDNMKVQKIIVK